MQPAFDIIRLKTRLVKNGWVGSKINRRTCLARLANDRKQPVNQLNNRISVFIFILMNQPAAFYCYSKLGRQRIYNGRTHAMQSAACLVCIIVKFAACMKRCKHDTFCADPFFMHTDRYASAIVGYRCRTILFQCNADFTAHPSQMLVHRIVHDFIYQMIQTLCRHTSDVHARPFPNCLKPLQDSDARGVVYIVICFCH